LNAEAGQLATWRAVEHSTCTRHRRYALNCGQWDVILERAAGKCEICGVLAADLAWARLHIDHDPLAGLWAIRGLLCDSCNYRLRMDRRLPQTPQIVRYLENAWYLKELRTRGLPAEMPPEPAGGWVSILGRAWLRRGDSDMWESTWGVRHPTKSWREMWRDYGPINLASALASPATERS
jgi:hypothetical protein